MSDSPFMPTAQSITDPLINMVIDERYRVVSRMARGGMATVYVAQDERLDRLVALKVMHPHLADSEQFTARFRREARSAAKVSHSRIVPIYDQGVVEGQGYLVMELVDGPDLRSFIATSGPLTLKAALQTTEQILDGLTAAHRAGVVHRDLKPENVLVTEDGSVKIVDFGLARAASEISVSTTGSILGTVAYLAPEVALSGQSDARTDIFAVGIMLYEMLTGELPGSNENPVQIALSRVNEDIPPPSALTPWLPTEVDELVTAFCARNPNERPSSALDALTLLRHKESDIPEEILERVLPQPAQSSTRVPDETMPIGRHGRTSVLPVQELVVQTSGSTVAPDAQNLSPRSRRWLIITTILLLVTAIALGVWWWWQQYGPGSYLAVPDVVGMQEGAAETELAKLNLASTVVTQNSDDVPEGEVIATDPEAGQPVHKTGEVQIIVSKGVLMLQIPDVAGLHPDEAEEELTEANFVIGSQLEEWSESVPEGEVIATQPASGETVRHDTLVSIVVSKGREPIAVPQVTNLSRAEAETAITGVELQVTVSEQFSDEVAEGFVVTQSPGPDETLHRGDTVSIVVSKGPEYVEVPNVYGRSIDDATAALEQAGFQVEVHRYASFFGIVGSQSPSSGEMARRGSTVTISVV